VATEVLAGLYQLKVPIPNNPLGWVLPYLIPGDDGYTLVDSGWNTIVGMDTERALRAWRESEAPASRPAFYGDGRSSERLVYLLDGDPLQAPWESLEAARLP